MNRKKDLYLLSEAYSEVLGQTKREPKWDYDDVIDVGGVTYYAQANYEKEEFYDKGDGVYTPPSSWVKTEIIEYNGKPDVKFYKENPDTGDFDVPVTQEQEPELFKKIYDALDEKIYEWESER